MNRETILERFLSHNPTLLATFGEYRLYEHPTLGDTAPIFMASPSGFLFNTGFYDLGEFGLALCHEIEFGL